jgi:hypothetical protein
MVRAGLVRTGCFGERVDPGNILSQPFRSGLSIRREIAEADMKTQLVVAISIIGAFSTSLSAQRGGARGGGVGVGGIGIGGGRSGFFGQNNFVAPFRGSFGPPGLRNFTNLTNFANGNFNNNGAFWGYPGWYGGLGLGFGDYGSYSSYAPTAAMITQPPAAAPVAATAPPTFTLPAPPPQPVVQVYHWPEPPASENDAVFSIVTNDGVVHQATLAWVQGDRLHFNLPDGGTSQLPLASISRKATKAANAEKHLTLPLP